MKYVYMVFVFFFFKQKTAYEITRRDWSSDVCSSDLTFEFKDLPLAHKLEIGLGMKDGEEKDRKSVVEGKRVPCCVDLVGVRIINKKTMRPARAGEAVMLVKARTEILMHYGIFPNVTGTPEKFGRELI